MTAAANPSFCLERGFTGRQLLALRTGRIGNMDEKWSWYMEGDALFLCRSWLETAPCYRIDLVPAGRRHGVTVIRPMKQSPDAERTFLTALLDRLVGPEAAEEAEKPLRPIPLKAPPPAKGVGELLREGNELEEQGKLEEAYRIYGQLARVNDARAMVAIAKLYLSGAFRPTTVSNLSDVLLQGGPILPWSVKTERRPDYGAALEWLTKAADLNDETACLLAGSMLCEGVGCEADVDRGLGYLKKASARGNMTAKKAVHLYQPSGKALSDESYEAHLLAFERAVQGGGYVAYEIYATLKSGTPKQLARLGYVLMAAQNLSRKGYEPFRYSLTPSGVPLLPVASRRGAWQTFVRFNLDAFPRERPLVAVAADILNVDDPSGLLGGFHRAALAGTATYVSPAFGWLKEEKRAVLLRLGGANRLEGPALEDVVGAFHLIGEEYEGDSVAFLVERGEKEYSLEVACVDGDRVDVLWRYTIGGSSRIETTAEPRLISMELTEAEEDA